MMISIQMNSMVKTFFMMVLGFTSLTAAAAVPGVPSSPSPGTTSSPGPTLSGSTVTLSWSSVAGATYYDLGVRDVATGALVVDTTTTSSSRTVTLTAGRQYRWNVAAGNSAGLSSYTTPRYFQTPSAATVPGVPGSPSPGTTSSPGPTLSGSTVTLSWSPVSGATYYDLGVRDVATGALVVDTTTTLSSRTVTLTAGRQYRWNVAAGNSAGLSDYTTPRYFQTPSAVTVPGVPGSPSPGTTSSPGPTLSGSTVTLSWSPVSGATYYDLGVRDVATGTLVVDTTTTLSSRTVTLTDGRQYRWNVAAGNSAGLSSYTTPRYFQTPSDGSIVLSVTPSSPPIQSSAASSLNLNVSNTGGGTMNYSAVVTSGSSWLSIVSGSSGGNSGTIVVSYMTNPSAQRSGTIQVTASGASGSPVTVTITQAGTGGGSSVPITHDFIPVGRNNRPAYPLIANFITIHDTDNSNVGANAVMHSNYLKNSDTGVNMPNNPLNPKSWHFTVDGGAIYQHLPTNENGWHAGDGLNGTGNRQSIGIEICMNGDGNRAQAEENAAWLTAKLLNDFGLSIDRVKQHYDWGLLLSPPTPKNCPSVLRGRVGGWDGFLARVAFFMNQSSPSSYVVSYSANGATSGTAPAAQTKTHGVTLTLRTNSGNLARTGYTFAGWNTQANGSGTDYPAGGSYTANASVTLYAKWTAVSSYTVSYSPNGATSGTTPASQTKTHGVTLTLRTNSGNLARSGYTFAGWNTAANGLGTDYAAGGMYTANAAVTLYAKWTVNTYTVSYNANGATSGSVPASQVKTHGVTLTLRTNSGNLARTGYTFAGWNTLANGSGTDYPAGGSYAANASVTLYAKWTAVASFYTVSYNANGATSGSVPSSQSKTHDVNLTLRTNSGNLARTGYIFAGWNTQASGNGTVYTASGTYSANASVTLYAKWAVSSGMQSDIDFDGDGSSDVVVYHPARGDWYMRLSSTRQLRLWNWGWLEAMPVPGDYDGDGETDLAVYHWRTGDWYIRQSSTGQLRRQNWGWSEAIPVAGDYDGDGETDLAVYHWRTGDWYIRMSSTGQLWRQSWGWSEAIPVPGDYDGDGATDIAVYHPRTGDWYIRMSSTGQLWRQNWGWSEANPVPGDYDGDGITDIAVYHPRTGDWYIRLSSTGKLRRIKLGWSETVPVPADYDGDGITDMAVYHPRTGDWHIIFSSTDQVVRWNWGWSEAIPTSRQYIINRWYRR